MACGGPRVDQMITQSKLKEILHYDPLTGIFVRRVGNHGCSAGQIAGTTTPKGYRQIRISYKLYLSHRSRLKRLLHVSYPSTCNTQQNKVPMVQACKAVVQHTHSMQQACTLLDTKWLLYVRKNIGH